MRHFLSEVSGVHKPLGAHSGPVWLLRYHAGITMALVVLKAAAMTVSIQNVVRRKSGILHWHVRVPKGLEGNHGGKAHLDLSLKTKDPQGAAARAAKLTTKATTMPIRGGWPLTSASPCICARGTRKHRPSVIETPRPEAGSSRHPTPGQTASATC